MGGERPPPLERSRVPEDPRLEEGISLVPSVHEGPPVEVEEEETVSAALVEVEGDSAEPQFAP